jgi:hypothetical protein
MLTRRFAPDAVAKAKQCDALTRAAVGCGAVLPVLVWSARHAVRACVPPVVGYVLHAAVCVLHIAVCVLQCACCMLQCACACCIPLRPAVRSVCGLRPMAFRCFGSQEPFGRCTPPTPACNAITAHTNATRNIQSMQPSTTPRTLQHAACSMRTLGPHGGAVVPQAQPGASGEAASAVLAADTEQVRRNECSRVRVRTARAGGGRSARRRACAAGPTAATDRARGTASDKQRRHTNAMRTAAQQRSAAQNARDGASIL